MTILFNPQYLVGHEALFKPIINRTNLLAKPYANLPNLFIHMLCSFIAGIIRRFEVVMSMKKTICPVFEYTARYCIESTVIFPAL